MIVVDLGCFPHGEERSIEPLIERFHPDVLYGFDPWPEMQEGDLPVGALPHEWGFPPGMHWRTHVSISRQAAWTYDGFIGYQQDGLRSRVYEAQFSDEEKTAVPCFDLAKFITDLYDGYYAGSVPDIVLKLDVEGAESELIPHLIARDADQQISLLLVEWHDARDFVEPYDRADLIARLRCEVEEWT